jgi:hypothetical protein
MEQRPPIHVRSPFLQGAGRPARAARNQAAPSTTSASPQSQAATALRRMSEATITSSSPRSSHYRLRRRPRRVRRCIAEGADAGVGPVHRHIVELPWQRAVDPLLELGSGQRYPFRAERAQTGAGDGEGAKQESDVTSARAGAHEYCRVDSGVLASISTEQNCPHIMSITRQMSRAARSSGSATRPSHAVPAAASPSTPDAS